ncbi:hypothetical protein AHAS_Ahas04G0105900 [Arachis hypogaea]
MTQSQPNSSLAELELEIERTLLCTRQDRRRLDYTASASNSLEEPPETLDGAESDLKSTTSLKKRLLGCNPTIHILGFAVILIFGFIVILILIL